ncbi:MAG: L-rhamnose mutarotase [Verrucomicrobiota bacterium]
MSPYENRLNSENFRRVALLAEVPAENKISLEGTLRTKPPTLAADLVPFGISHLHIYLKVFKRRSVLFVYFEMDELDQEKAVPIFKKSSAWWTHLEPFLESHPRAAERDTPWKQAEFINVVADNTARSREIGKPMGLTAGLHPEKELWYRTLHQTNWPGVTDQMRRSSYQNWTTFLLEFGDELMLFTHVEYLGKDQAADDALMKEDPVTNRWWTHTEPCLYPLVDSGNNWTLMNEF